MSLSLSSELLSRRLLIITGKGGVGKTTIAYALALLGAKLRKKVLLVQIKSKDSLYQLFGIKENNHSIKRLDDFLWSTNINPEEALAEYGNMVLHSSFLYRNLFERETVQNLLRSIPGLLNYAALGKIWYHTTEELQGKPRFDLIIVDGPATGHALTLLQIPRIILKTVKEGPLTGPAQACYNLLTNPHLCLAPIVTLAEELPFMESLQLGQGLTKQNIQSGALFINRFSRSQLSKEESALLLSLKQNFHSFFSLFEAVEFYKQQALFHEDYQMRLAKQLPLPQICIPLISSSVFSKTTLFTIASLIEKQE